MKREKKSIELFKYKQICNFRLAREKAIEMRMMNDSISSGY